MYYIACKNFAVVASLTKKDKSNTLELYREKYGDDGGILNGSTDCG